MFRAILMSPAGMPLFEKYDIRGTPAVLLLDAEGNEIDFHPGYKPPAKAYREAIERSLGGKDTVKSLTDLIRRKPDDIQAVLALGRKMEGFKRFRPAVEYFRRVMALDPKGMNGSTEFNGQQVGAGAYAELGIATIALYGVPPNPNPMKTFLSHSADGPLNAEAFRRMDELYYNRRESSTEAVDFYEQYAVRHAGNRRAFDAWLSRILNGNETPEKMLERALKAASLAGKDPEKSAGAANTLARVYLIRKEKTKAISAAERAFRAAPENTITAGDAADLLISAGSLEKAEELYGKAYAKKHKENAALLLSFAIFWEERGANRASARSAAKRAIRLEPESSGIQRMMARYLLLRKDFRGALKYAEKALALAQGEKPIIIDDLKKFLADIQAKALEEQTRK